MFFAYFDYLLNFKRVNFFSNILNRKVNLKKFNKPRIYFYKKKKYNYTILVSKFANLKFGDSVFFPSSPLILSSLFLLRFVLFFKKIIKKKDKSLRKFWLVPKTLIRVTKQSKGARMGKGKGKHIFLIQRFPPFSSFIEFKGVRSGRLFYFLKKFNSRMPVLFRCYNNRSFIKTSKKLFFK